MAWRLVGSIHFLVQNVVLLNSDHSSLSLSSSLFPLVSFCRSSMDVFLSHPFFLRKTRTRYIPTPHCASKTHLYLIPSVMYYIRCYPPSPAIESLFPCPYPIPPSVDIVLSLIPVVDRVLSPHKSRAFPTKSPVVDVSLMRTNTACRYSRLSDCHYLSTSVPCSFFATIVPITIFIREARPRAWSPVIHNLPYVQAADRDHYQYRRERSSAHPRSHNWNE